MKVKVPLQEKTGWKYILASVGPGIILTATSVGPGSVATSVNAGALYGYSLAWWIVLVMAFRVIFSLAMNRYTAATGKPVMVGIRESYGPVWAIIAGVFAFIGQCIYSIGNFMGCALGISILFPMIPFKLGGVICVVICAVLLFMRNLYGKVEKFMTVLVGLMVVIFIASLIATAGLEDPGIVTHSLLPLIPPGSLALMLSMLGTSTSIATCAWGSSLVADKGFKAVDLKKGGINMDVIVGAVVMAIITLAMYFIGANLLPGQPIANGGDLAAALVSVFGPFIRPLFGIAFLAAALSSLMMAPKLGINLLLQSLNRKSGMDNKVENIVTIAMMAFAMIIGLVFNGIPAQLLIVAQLGGVINTPILGVLTILLVNQKKLGEYRTKLPLTILLIISWVFMMFTVVNTIIGLL